MVRFFHGTHCGAIPQILRTGLVVSEIHEDSVHLETFDPHDATEDRFAGKGVYLTGDIEGACWYGYDASKGCGGRPECLERADADYDNMCVIEVDLPETFKVGSDGYGAYMTNDQDIPPEYIKKVYYPKDLKKMNCEVFMDYEPKD